VSRSRAWSVAFGLARRQVSRTIKSPPLLLPPLLFPLMLFGAFAGGLSALGAVPAFAYPDYTTFQFVWVLLTGMAISALATGLALAQDYETGFARRILLATSQRWPLVVGYVLAGLIRGILVGAALVAVGLLAGMEVTSSPLDLAGFFALALLFNVAVSLWAVGVALRTRSSQAGPLLQTPVLIALFLVPVYTERDLLVGWVHTAADVNPLTRLVEPMRTLVIGEPDDVPLAFGVVLGLVVLLTLWAVTGLQSAPKAQAKPARRRRRRRAAPSPG
jgi:ABC-2 type transport system permease protein